ncbi:MAG: M20/M25/M40 family metallo-hydrolase [Vulcanimicrobiaceae bacterium]
MNVRQICSVTALLALCSSALPVRAAGTYPMPKLPVDPAIAAMVAAVSPADLRRIETKLVGFTTRNDFSERTSTKTRGVFAARAWLLHQFRKVAATTHGRMTVRLDTFVQPKTARTPRAVLESSVIATLRGSEPGRVYVFSSHYDDCNGDCTDGAHVAPGADDNGSGVSAVLEAARVMARHHFRGTIVFACFDGEELGLWGSAHYTKELRANHVHVLADLNDDIVGSSIGHSGQHDPNTVRVFSEAIPAGAKISLVNLLGSENDSPSRELSRFVAETVPVYLPGFHIEQIFRADRFLRGGDQESFQAAGYPAVRFTEPHENFNHQHQNVRVSNGIRYGDLLKYIRFNYLARVTRANVAALAALALGPASPPHVVMPLSHLGYTTPLRWTPAADATSYEIVWRRTTSPVWQHATNVGDVTQAKAPRSYDNWIFGVRSVNAQGLRSPAVYPKPVRV